VFTAAGMLAILSPTTVRRQRG